MKPETIAIHGGYASEPTTKAVAVPIYQTVAYEFDNAQHGADLFNLAVPGNIYTRIMNPTNDVLEQRIAQLEGGVAALAVSAGSAAVNYSIINLAEAGNNIVTVPLLYGGTYTLFKHMLPKLGIDVRFAADDSPASLEKLIDDKTSAVYCESIGNPAGNIPDLEAISDMSHSHGIPVIVDNTVPTPALTRPFDYGVDIVVHSLTKYMGGHGTTIAGAIVDSGNFPWAEHAERFPMFSEPEASYHGIVYTEALGPAAYIGRARTVALRNTGSALSPFNAFLIMQGLETLSLRMGRHARYDSSVHWHRAYRRHHRRPGTGFGCLAIAKPPARAGLSAFIQRHKTNRAVEHWPGLSKPYLILLFRCPSTRLTPNIRQSSVSLRCDDCYPQGLVSD